MSHDWSMEHRKPRESKDLRREVWVARTESGQETSVRDAKVQRTLKDLAQQRQHRLALGGQVAKRRKHPDPEVQAVREQIEQRGGAAPFPPQGVSHATALAQVKAALRLL